MSFWPFPTSLAAELREASSRGVVVELGAGAGDLARRLEQLGLVVLTLDVDASSPVDVVADLRNLPFAAASAGVLVLGDVLRHLDPLSRDDAAASCARVLAPGGCVVVLEDHPEGRDAAEANYREVLALLADVAPPRGPARPIDRLTRPWREHLGEPVLAGAFDNETPVRDPTAPVRWMRRMAGGDRAFRSRLDALADAIDRDGMDYGRSCFEVFRRDESGS